MKIVPQWHNLNAPNFYCWFLEDKQENAKWKKQREQKWSKLLLFIYYKKHKGVVGTSINYELLNCNLLTFCLEMSAAKDLWTVPSLAPTSSCVSPRRFSSEMECLLKFKTFFSAKRKQTMEHKQSNKTYLFCMILFYFPEVIFLAVFEAAFWLARSTIPFKTVCRSNSTQRASLHYQTSFRVGAVHGTAKLMKRTVTYNITKHPVRSYYHWIETVNRMKN